MTFWKSVSGMVRVNLTAADPASAIEELASLGITLYDAKRIEDDIITIFTVERRNLPALYCLAERKGYVLKVGKMPGIYWTIRTMLRRPVLILGVLMILCLAVFLPSRVLFIRVEGNSSVPVLRILEESDRCGIRFGASRESVRSEKVKNALLEAIPELQWVGVNTVGCVATITVRERTNLEEPLQENCVCSLIAGRDGIITRYSVTGGSNLVQVGQAVKAGQLLVSGYTDCGIRIQATHSQGEIYAQTQHTLTVMTPTEYLSKEECGVIQKKYALILGKNRINFYKGSGISGISCDKIYSEQYITLPGGFQLPAAIITETWIYYTDGESVPSEDADALLDGFADRYLPGRMVAGRILSREERITEEDGIAILQGYYACEEMIAQVRKEEIIKPYGNDH